MLVITDTTSEKTVGVLVKSSQLGIKVISDLLLNSLPTKYQTCTSGVQSNKETPTNKDRRGIYFLINGVKNNR